MAKTLADMTAEERAECVGMWCSIAGAGRLCVLLSTENDVANLGFSCANEFTILYLRYKNVTPRFDLPRAWTPDGEPELAQTVVEEAWEYAVQVKIGAKWLFLGRGTGGHNFARNAFWFVKKENAQDYMAIRKDMSAPTRIVRQRRSPVEVINE